MAGLVALQPLGSHTDYISASSIPIGVLAPETADPEWSLSDASSFDEGSTDSDSFVWEGLRVINSSTTSRTPHRNIPNSLDGYAAAWFDLFGDVNCHPFVEGDGRVYLRISIVPFASLTNLKGSQGVRYNMPDTVHPVLKWIEQNFGGRVEFGSWHATGDRAAELLRRWQPFLLRNRQIIGDALQAWDRRSTDRQVMKRLVSGYEGRSQDQGRAG